MGLIKKIFRSLDRRQKNSRVAYYAKAYGKLILPDRFFQHKAERLLFQYPVIPPDLQGRLDYYCKLVAPFNLTGSTTLTDIRSHPRTTYFLDFYPFIRAFPDAQRFNTLFGDVTTIPKQPSFVKSRPIEGDNKNSVLMKLGSVRHFTFVKDPLDFRKKHSALVWRGRLHPAITKERRLDFLREFTGKPRLDIGHINRGNVFPEFRRERLSIPDQLNFKYILSLEGVDVATNLKWIMSSNSLCFSQRLKFETWYMEGRLQPGVHYVEIADDFSDVEQKIDYYENHPSEAEQIIANANAYTQQFFNQEVEDLLSYLVVKRYLELSTPV
ncbi:MAG: glycosyl transferase family 90 [Burkholderiales bacterium]|jgi:hypothetical protein|nr:glycosyl transferase family 90 [Burkholderiales bacterium]